MAASGALRLRAARRGVAVLCFLLPQFPAARSRLSNLPAGLRCGHDVWLPIRLFGAGAQRAHGARVVVCPHGSHAERVRLVQPTSNRWTYYGCVDGISSCYSARAPTTCWCVRAMPWQTQHACRCCTTAHGRAGARAGRMQWLRRLVEARDSCAKHNNAVRSGEFGVGRVRARVRGCVRACAPANQRNVSRRAARVRAAA